MKRRSQSSSVLRTEISSRYYRVADQAEYATDLLFRTPQDLAGLYGRLVDHAALNFSAQDIPGFLG